MTPWSSTRTGRGRALGLARGHPARAVATRTGSAPPRRARHAAPRSAAGAGRGSRCARRRRAGRAARSGARPGEPPRQPTRAARTDRHQGQQVVEAHGRRRDGLRPRRICRVADHAVGDRRFGAGRPLARGTRRRSGRVLAPGGPAHGRSTTPRPRARAGAARAWPAAGSRPRGCPPGGGRRRGSRRRAGHRTRVPRRAPGGTGRRSRSRRGWTRGRPPRCASVRGTAGTRAARTRPPGARRPRFGRAAGPAGACSPGHCGASASPMPAVAAGRGRPFGPLQDRGGDHDQPGDRRRVVGPLDDAERRRVGSAARRGRSRSRWR